LTPNDHGTKRDPLTANSPSASTDAMLTIEPAPRARKPGSTAWVSRVNAVILTAVVSSNAPGLSVANEPKLATPALLIKAVIAGSLDIRTSTREP
jgi:hypothetical protein